MKIKLFMISLVCIFSCFQILKASEQKKPLQYRVGYLGITDIQPLEAAPLCLTMTPGFDVRRLVGQPLVQVGSVQDLRNSGLEKAYSLVALNQIRCSDGRKGFIGIAPAGATLYTLPAGEGYFTMGYQCSSGVKVFVPLSEQQTSRELPKF